DNAAGIHFPWTPHPGTYTLHSTAFTGSNGSGAAGTSLTINFAVTLVPPIITAVIQSSNGHFIIKGQADPLSSLSIQASPDLISTFGTPSSVGADSSGAFQHEDANAADYSKRFYRAHY